MPRGLPKELHADVRTLWEYHDLRHEPRVSDAGIGLGSHDPGVAVHTAGLFRAGMFPLVVFTGANAPTTVDRFPRGEAVHYREIALGLGVPDDVILVEPEARNTGDNIVFTRRLLEHRGIAVRSVTLVSRPYQQRRAYATAKRWWPGVDVVCASRPVSSARSAGSPTPGSPTGSSESLRSLRCRRPGAGRPARGRISGGRHPSDVVARLTRWSSGSVRMGW
jgi:uncharacterized SAM-binding protein YcdF (DUF218 family)